VSLINRAIEAYERAGRAEIRPESAAVDDKVHVNLGKAYLLRAQVLQSTDDFQRAESEYQSVIIKYEGGKSDLRPLAALAYVGRGIEEEQLGREKEAIDFYKKAISAAKDTKPGSYYAEISHQVEQTATSQLAGLAPSNP